MGIGKLVLEDSLKVIIEKEIKSNRWELLPVHLNHTWYLGKIPPIHKDPFDRLLIAQAMLEGLVIATKDPLILSYKQVKTVWE